MHEYAGDVIKDCDQGPLRSRAVTEADPGNNNRLSDEELITKRGNKWEAAFAEAGPVPYRYMGQPACERADCERVGGWPIKNCKPLPSKFRESFADATVERVVVDGHRAKISEDHNLTTAVATISVP